MKGRRKYSPLVMVSALWTRSSCSTVIPLAIMFDPSIRANDGMMAPVMPNALSKACLLYTSEVRIVASVGIYHVNFVGVQPGPTGYVGDSAAIRRPGRQVIIAPVVGQLP